ncbi:MAG: hypothetical protein LBL25_05085 [Oscillospiraceae bacterium]|jgi:hypothetical protein|nr:hypothetical protein [Oscillospiraceae bacterium]
MKKLLSKRVISLAIAVVMAVSLFALSASAASPGIGVKPNTELWWADDTLATPFYVDLVIDGETETFEIGINTIQEFVLEGSNYVISTHPQYFGGNDPDDEAGAWWVFQLSSISVWDEQNQSWTGNLLRGGEARIRSGFALPDPITDPQYFLCQVEGTIFYVGPDPDPDPVPADIPVYWETAYLEIPSQV